MQHPPAPVGVPDAPTCPFSHKCRDGSVLEALPRGRGPCNVPCAWPVFIRSACVLASAALTPLQVIPWARAGAQHVTSTLPHACPCAPLALVQAGSLGASGQHLQSPPGTRWGHLYPQQHTVVSRGCRGRWPGGPCASLTQRECGFLTPPVAVAFIRQVSGALGVWVGTAGGPSSPWAALAFLSGRGLHTHALSSGRN